MADLALAFFGFDPLPEGTVKASVQWASREGFRAIQLDARRVRGREFDRSARRDLAAHLRRSEVAFAGLDLWIPSTHFHATEHVDRAVGAVLDAISLCDDLATLDARDGGRSVSLVFDDETPDGVRLSLESEATRRGVTLIDYGTGAPSEHRGVDPATCLVGGVDPMSRLGGAVGARLSDASHGMRVPVGSGELDVMAWRISTETFPFVVADVRGLAAPGEGARRACRAWREALPFSGPGG